MIKYYVYYFIPSLCSLLSSVMDVFNDNDNVVLIIIISLLHFVVVERLTNIDNDNNRGC